VVIIGTNGTCHGQNTKKHETMLNGKFASYELKANSYINLGNVCVVCCAHSWLQKLVWFANYKNVLHMFILLTVKSTRSSWCTFAFCQTHTCSLWQAKHISTNSITYNTIIITLNAENSKTHNPMRAPKTLACVSKANMPPNH
jgi:hypothetical protein